MSVLDVVKGVSHFFAWMPWSNAKTSCSTGKILWYNGVLLWHAVCQTMGNHTSIQVFCVCTTRLDMRTIFSGLLSLFALELCSDSDTLELSFSLVYIRTHNVASLNPRNCVGFHIYLNRTRVSPVGRVERNCTNPTCSLNQPSSPHTRANVYIHVQSFEILPNVPILCLTFLSAFKCVACIILSTLEILLRVHGCLFPDYKLR